jgi:hypothetical protein
MVMNNPYRIVQVGDKDIEIHDAVWIDDRVPSKSEANKDGQVLTLIGFQSWDSIIKHELWMPYPKKDEINDG